VFILSNSAATGGRNGGDKKIYPISPVLDIAMNVEKF
jgi:hypothetical protein